MEFMRSVQSLESLQPYLRIVIPFAGFDPNGLAEGTMTNK
jgi:hypothetical protein